MTAQPSIVNPPLIPKGRIGRFVYEQDIGQGSVGIVYLFRDPLIGRKVAIKVLNPQISPAQRQLFEKQFIQEARAAGRLNHPNIVTVYDADKSDDVLFIVMEYLEGKELRDLLLSGTEFSYKQIAEMVGRIAMALDYAHENGVIHRDIKPANIFITSTGTPKVLDFGIARASRQLSDPEATFGQDLADNRMMGTPNYMSPEQARSESVDARSDIFSLGVVLYQLLCGQLPFQGKNVDAILQAIIREPAVPPQEIKPDVPLRLARIAAKALSKKPADRYQRASDMARDLNRFLEKERAERLIAKIQQPEQDKAKLDKEKPSGALRAFSAPAGWAIAALALLLLCLGWWLRPGAVNVKPVPAVNAKTATAMSSVDATPAASATAPSPPAAVVTETITEPSPANKEATASEVAQPAVKDQPARPMAAEQKTVAQAKAKSQKSTGPAAVTKDLKAPVNGVVTIAVSPWGEVFVDGQAKGVAPPLTSLNLPVGKHKIEIRNGDESHVLTVEVNTEKSVKVSHRF